VSRYQLASTFHKDILLQNENFLADSVKAKYLSRFYYLSSK